MSDLSALIKCKCGKTQCWITEGKVIKNSCPECGRKYSGKYNPKTFTIDAIEIKGVTNEQNKLGLPERFAD